MRTVRRDVFQAIADPTRREILALISRQAMNLNALAENFMASRPAISQHVKILEECGLVRISQHGRERYCVLRLEKLNEIAEWIEPFRKLWESKFENLDNLLIELQTKPKNQKK